MRGTRARRLGLSFAATLFFLEGERARAQAQAQPEAPGARWGVVAVYGQASAPGSQGFAETAALSLVRDFDLGGNFTLGVEVTPLFAVNLTRVDLPERPRHVAYAAAASPLLAWTIPPGSFRVGFRLEAGVGLSWGFSPIPAEGSRFNFLDQFGALLLVRAGPERLVSLGVRRSHLSNLGLAGPGNPGLSFYSGALGLSWPAR